MINVTESLTTLLVNLREQSEETRRIRNNALQQTTRGMADRPLVRAAEYYRKWRRRATSIRSDLKDVGRLIREKNAHDRIALRNLWNEYTSNARRTVTEQRVANRPNLNKAAALRVKLNRAQHRIRMHERKLVEIYKNREEIS